MNLTIAAEPVPLRLAEGGRVYRVGDTRVSLDSVIYAHRSGSTAQEIVRDFDTLKLSDVLVVLAYYLNHKEEVDRYIEEREADVDQIRQQIDAGSKQQELRARWLAEKARGA